ncbi:MAG: hypothetical protein U9R48_09905 [Chloroflexota bacterium]|nr:hypothetical protein [Chloroflexota bacterium]
MTVGRSVCSATVGRSNASSLQKHTRRKPMSNLTTLTARVAADLKDAAHATWSAEEIAQQIRRALQLYNEVAPRRLAGTLDTVAGQREYDLSSLPNLADVVDVHYPYDVTDPPYPPHRAPWRLLDASTLYLEVAVAPSGAAGETIRVFYTAPHTIDGLDGASATTLPAWGEHLVVLGATAYCVQQRAQAVTGTVTVSERTPDQLAAWAEARRAAFRRELARLRAHAAQVGSARVAWGGGV